MITTPKGLKKIEGIDFVKPQLDGADQKFNVNMAEIELRLSGKADATHDHDELYEAKNTNIQAHIVDTQNPHRVTASQVGAVPATRKVNGKELSADVQIAAGDIGAAETEHTHTVAQIADFPFLNTGEKTLYVSNAGNDAMGDGTQANPYREIQTAFDSVPQNFVGGLKIIVNCVGTVPNMFRGLRMDGARLRRVSVEFKDVGRSEKPCILGESKVSNGRFYFENLKFAYSKNISNSEAALAATYSNVMLQGCELTCGPDGPASTVVYGFTEEYGQAAIMQTSFANCYAGAYCSYGGTHTISWSDISDGCAVAVSAVGCIVLMNDMNIPTGTTQATVQDGAVVFRDGELLSGAINADA